MMDRLMSISTLHSFVVTFSMPLTYQDYWVSIQHYRGEYVQCLYVPIPLQLDMARFFAMIVVNKYVIGAIM